MLTALARNQYERPAKTAARTVLRSTSYNGLTSSRNSKP
jgi:hypothetical protein